MHLSRERPSLCAIALALLCLAVFGGMAFGADDSVEKTPHRLPRVNGGFKVDARLDEPFWRDALKLELKYEVRPAENTPAEVKTEVLLAYNGTHLLAGFRAYDPDPAQIKAFVTDRDQLFDDDWVALIFDSFNDQRRYFDFFVNPLGVQGDIVETVGVSNAAWDAIWDSAGEITEYGYCVEIAIPFSSMRFQRANGEQEWKFDAVRSYKRSVDHRLTLFPRDRNNQCYICQAERLVGFDGATPGKNIELDPTFSSLYSQGRSGYTEGDFEERSKRNEFGLNARWGITPNIQLNATANPDFSQVEADAAQLDINTNYALFYEEKRPFFLEGAELFNMAYTVLHTRNFADPDWGMKVTGKEGKGAMGFYAVQDRKLNLLFPGNEGSRTTTLDEQNYGTVARYRRDVMSNSTVGLILTDREAEDFYNRVAGVDANFRFLKTETVRLTFLGSQTRYPAGVASDYDQPAESFVGGAMDFNYTHNTKGLDWYASYRENGANFRGHLGFIPMGDWRYGEVGWGRTWNRDANSWFTVFNVGSNFNFEDKLDGTPMSRCIGYWTNYTGPMQSQVDVSGNLFSRIYYRSLEIDWNSVNLYVKAAPVKSLTLYFNGRYGNNIDYANEREGVSLRLNPWIDYRIGRHISIGLDHTYEWLDVDGGRLYTAAISQARLIYQFNKRMFLRSVLQYVNYDRNAGLYTFEVPERDENVFTQFLFSYKINPQTVLYLGYSDNYFGDASVDLTQTDRTFFAKIGYAWIP